MPCSARLSQEVAMSLWQFVVSKTQQSLPTAEQTGIGERATSCANEEVEKVCDCGAPGEPRKGSTTPHITKKMSKNW